MFMYIYIYTYTHINLPEKENTPEGLSGPGALFPILMNENSNNDNDNNDNNHDKYSMMYYSRNI